MEENGVRRSDRPLGQDAGMGKKIYLLIIVLSLFSASCGKSREEHFSSPEANEPGTLPYYRVASPPQYSEPEGDISKKIFSAASYGGTISHHALASDYIHAWFLKLKETQQIKTFILIGPDHFDRTRQEIAISTKNWVSENGEISADSALAEKILSAYRLQEEDSIFRHEHGIRVLVPYIIKYFPESKIVPIVQKDHHFRKQYLENLTEIIQRAINSGEEYFVLVSADFSHYEGITGTAENDAISEYYLNNQWLENPQPPVCDNTAGIYILNRLHGYKNEKNEIHLFSYTNSWLIARKQADNITSYFFTFYF